MCDNFRWDAYLSGFIFILSGYPPIRAWVIYLLYLKPREYPRNYLKESQCVTAGRHDSGLQYI